MPIRPRFCCFTVFFNCLVHNMALKSRMSMKRAVFVYFNFWFGIIKVTERPEAWIQGDHLSIKIPFYQHRDSRYKDKMVSQPSYVCNGNSIHPSSLHWDRAQGLWWEFSAVCTPGCMGWWMELVSQMRLLLDFCLALWFLTEVNVFRSEMCILVL